MKEAVTRRVLSFTLIIWLLNRLSVGAAGAGDADSSFGNPLRAGEAVAEFLTQTDGRIVVADAANVRVFRMNRDGGRDTGFASPELPLSTLEHIAQSSSGAILATGRQTADHLSSAIVRLTSNGNVDSSFQAALSKGEQIICWCVLADDSIVYFADLFLDGPEAQTMTGHLGKLRPDGSADATFRWFETKYGRVHTIIRGSDGSVLVGGSFELPGNGVLHLDSSGARIMDVNMPYPSRAFLDEDPTVFALAWDASGKLLVGSNFLDRSNTKYPDGLLRLDRQGELDPTFAPPPINGAVTHIEVQVDGKIIAFGKFKTVGTAFRPNVARFLPSGALDEGFAAELPATAEQVSGVLLPDGAAIMSGSDRTGQAFLRVLETGEAQPGLPAFVSPPEEVVGTAGTSFTLGLPIRSQPTATYQWFKQQYAITNATNSFMTFTNLTRDDLSPLAFQHLSGRWRAICRRVPYSMNPLRACRTG